MADRTQAVDAWEALFRAQVAMVRQLGSRFPDEGVSFTEYDVLFNLSRQPERTLRIRDLNRHLLLTQPSVSRMVDRLAARGLVTKGADPGDGRGTLVRLTDAGHDAFRRAAVRHGDEIAQRMTSSLDDDDLARLTEICDKLRAGLGG